MQLKLYNNVNLIFINQYNLRKGFAQEGDVLLTHKATIGETAIVPKIEYPYLMLTPQVTFYRIKDSSKLNNGYLKYYFTSQTFQKQLKLWSGAGSTRAYIGILEQLNLPIEIEEDIAKQQKIATVLSTLDAKIELNNKINTELEAMAKTLYDYWFVQFDFPNENGKPYKSSGGEMVWSEELKRKIPKGWEVENLKNNSLTSLIKPSIDFFEGEKTYLATADVVNNEINFGADKITFENRESRANMQPIQDSIWFAKMKNTKKVLCVGEYSNYFLEKFILSTGFAGIKCKEKFYLEYMWGVINSDYFEIIKDRLSNGATQEAINNDSMAFIPLIIPSENILKEYHKKTFEIYKKIYLNQIENQKLAELRDFLLPMLMNGQVVVE